MNAETRIQDAIRVALGAEADLVLWRNSVGQAEHWNGREVRRVRYGLAPGSADLVGILRLPSGVGRWFALEVKTAKGRAAEEQRQWLDLVRRMGGFACVARSVEEARAALGRARNGEAQ